MNKSIFLAAIALLTIYTGYSQDISGVSIKDFALELKEDKQLNVDIDIDLSQLKIKTTQVVVLTPCIINGADTLKLKAIGIYGRNRRIFYQRNEQNKPTDNSDINLTKSARRDIVNYNTSVKFVDWMDGCSVKLLRTDCGCCGHSAVVAQSELIDRFPLERYLPELIYLRPQREVVKTRRISGSAFVDFPVSQTVIHPSYRNNYVELAKITSTIDSVKRDSDITIKAWRTNRCCLDC